MCTQALEMDRHNPRPLPTFPLYVPVTGQSPRMPGEQSSDWDRAEAGWAEELSEKIGPWWTFWVVCCTQVRVHVWESVTRSAKDTGITRGCGKIKLWLIHQKIFWTDLFLHKHGSLSQRRQHAPLMCTRRWRKHNSNHKHENILHKSRSKHVKWPANKNRSLIHEPLKKVKHACLPRFMKHKNSTHWHRTSSKAIISKKTQNVTVKWTTLRTMNSILRSGNVLIDTCNTL